MFIGRAPGHTDIGSEESLLWGRPVHCRVFSNSPGMAGRTSSQVVINKNDSTKKNDDENPLGSKIVLG